MRSISDLIRQQQEAEDLVFKEIDPKNVEHFSSPPQTGHDVFKPITPPRTVDDIVTERGQAYGHPLDNFSYARALKRAIYAMPDSELKEAAEMICTKLSRLVHSPEHLDTWDDIAGYAKTARMVIEERKRRGRS